MPTTYGPPDVVVVAAVVVVGGTVVVATVVVVVGGAVVVVGAAVVVVGAAVVVGATVVAVVEGVAVVTVEAGSSAPDEHAAANRNRAAMATRHLICRTYDHFLWASRVSGPWWNTMSNAAS